MYQLVYFEKFTFNGTSLEKDMIFLTNAELIICKPSILYRKQAYCCFFFLQKYL